MLQMTEHKKAIILGDTHFGVKNDSEAFLDYFIGFIKDILIPYAIEHDIKLVLQLGDFCDKRKGINFKTMNRVVNEVLNEFAKHDIQFISFPGNHDIYYRHSNSINSLNECFSWVDGVTIINEPTTIQIGELMVDFIPWINKYNHDETVDFIKKSTSNICLGHFDIDGFDMSVGVSGHGDLKRSLFGNYDHVYSGHYHTRSTQGNITYVGTPYEMTWSDYNDPKGFHVLALDKNATCEFIRNPLTMFTKLMYEYGCDYDPKEITNHIVKMVVKDRAEVGLFEKIVEEISSLAPLDFSIVESDEIVAHGIDEERLEVLDTYSILIEAANNIAENEKLNPKTFTKIIHELYSEAQELARESQ